MIFDERRLERMLIGRIKRAVHYKFERMHEEAAIVGPDRERAEVLAELARQGRWASMVGRLGKAVPIGDGMDHESNY